MNVLEQLIKDKIYFTYETLHGMKQKISDSSRLNEADSHSIFTLSLAFDVDWQDGFNGAGLWKVLKFDSLEELEKFEQEIKDLIKEHNRTFRLRSVAYRGGNFNGLGRMCMLYDNYSSYTPTY